MALIPLLLCFGLVHVYGHYRNIPKIEKLKQEVDELKAQMNVYEQMDNLETSLYEKLSVYDNFGERLTDMEETVNALKKYLMKEKRKDIDLTSRSEEAIRRMNGKVSEAKDLVDSTKVEISNSVSEFENRLLAVNESAQRNMDVEGVIMYGGVGTSCSAGNDGCAVEKSECRHGRCQCEPGYSYNAHEQECTTSCEKYSKTFQSVGQRVIRGHNDAVFENVSFPECKKSCFDADFVCRSIDYFDSLRECYLSSVTALEVEDDWEYNSIGCHFQRDCA